MKKLFALLLAAIMLLSLAACNNNETPSGSEGDNPGVSQNNDQEGENANDNTDLNDNETQNSVDQNGEYTFEGCKAYLSNDMKFVGFNFPDDLTVVDFEYGDGAAKVTYCPVDSGRHEEIVQALFSGTKYTVTDTAGKSVSQSTDVLDITLDERLYTHGFHLVKDDGDNYLVVIEYWPIGYQLFDVSFDAETLCIYIYGG